MKLAAQPKAIGTQMNVEPTAEQYLELLEENQTLREELRTANAQLERLLTSRWWKLNRMFEPQLRLAVRLLPKKKAADSPRVDG